MPIYLATDGAGLTYRDAGPHGGVPLLLIHGWQADGRMWEPLSALLVGSHRVIVPDLRGTGGSNGAPGPYTVAQFASDLGDLIDSLGLDPVVAIGHSMGGAVAQRLAIDRPEAVEGLVLVAAVAASGVPFSANVLEFLRSTCGDSGQAAAWLKGLTHRELDESTARLLTGAAATISASVAQESFESWHAGDFADEAATIDTPALVLAPSEDRPMTQDYQRERVAAIINGSRFEVLAECGHYAPVEQPEAVAQAIERFVEEL